MAHSSRAAAACRATLEATADHGEVTGDTIGPNYAQAQADLDALAAVGIDYDDVVQVLEDDVAAKFEQSRSDLQEAVGSAQDRMSGT